MSKQKIKKEIQSITNQLIQNYKPEKIILFGSAASGNFGPDSDIDILIIKDGLGKVKRHERHYQVRKLLESILPLDILVFTPYEIDKRLYLGDPFIKNIMSKGKVLYGA